MEAWICLWERQLVVCLRLACHGMDRRETSGTVASGPSEDQAVQGSSIPSTEYPTFVHSGANNFGP
jgi:hypothetical protein